MEVYFKITLHYSLHYSLQPWIDGLTLAFDTMCRIGTQPKSLRCLDPRDDAITIMHPVYLGVIISGDWYMDRKVEQIIGAASKMIEAIGSTLLGMKELSKCMKLRVINVTVIPTLTFGCEAWDLHAKHREKIQTTPMRVLRQTEGGVEIRQNKKCGY